jgi:FKBP-type peptidyl-prolyl cis-trans isomerase SlyD
MSRKLIEFHYKLRNDQGEMIDSSSGGPPFSLIEGARQIIPALEKELLPLEKGSKKSIYLEAARAYGLHQSNLVVKIPRKQLPSQQIRIGDSFRGGPQEDAPVFLVLEINDNEAMLDGNHPLAGVNLVFEVEIMESRQATQEEIDRVAKPNPH